MFKVGQRYSFVMIIGGDETSFGGVIETYEHPLIKLEDIAYDSHRIRIVGVSPDGETTAEGPTIDVKPSVIPGKIINVTSPNFVSAEANIPRTSGD